MSRAGRVRRYRDQRARGLCADCAEPAASGRARCQRHLEMIARAVREHYARRRAAVPAC